MVVSVFDELWRNWFLFHEPSVHWVMILILTTEGVDGNRFPVLSLWPVIDYRSQLNFLL